MPLPKIEGQNLAKPLCYDPERKKFIRFDEIVSGEESIIPLEHLSEDDLKTLIIERQRCGPDYRVQAISGPPHTRDEVVAAIQRGDKIGRMTMEAETSHLRDLLRQIQHHLDQERSGRADSGR